MAVTLHPIVLEPLPDSRQGKKTRGNNEGSIYQRADTGRWFATVTLPGTGGKRKYYSGTTKTAVEEQLRKVLESPLTLSEWLDEWEGRRAEDSRRATWLSNRSYIKKHIRPQLGHHKLVDVTATDVERFLAKLVAQGYEGSTVRRAHCILAAVLGDARRAGLLRGNPARDALLHLHRDAVEPLPMQHYVRCVEVTHA